MPLLVVVDNAQSEDMVVRDSRAVEETDGSDSTVMLIAIICQIGCRRNRLSGHWLNRQLYGSIIAVAGIICYD